jgi:DNA-binding CsgD family transcriptional regulator
MSVTATEATSTIVAADRTRVDGNLDSRELLRPDADAQWPQFVVEAGSLKLKHANSAGRAMLDVGNMVRVRKGRLVVGSDRVTRDLSAATECFPEIRSSLVVLDFDQGIHVLTWTGEAGGESSQAVPLIQLRLVPGDFESSLSEMNAIAHGFGLTNAERDVLALIVHGLSIKEIAESRQVRLETVRRQYKVVLAKLRCHRQIDAVRLVMSLSATARLAML